jgi:hypothetical protein
MKKTILLIVPLMIIGILISGCTLKSKYDRKLKHELATGVRNDSMFLGLYLGMPDKAFFTHCWNLNRRGLVKQGGTNTTVEYQISHELKHPCLMNFYPSFVNGKIAEMPVRFVYNGWAPWNKELSSDKLQLDILNWYKKAFGEDFMEVKHPSRGLAFVNLNGNRQISIFKEDELHVWAVFTDMSIKKELITASKMKKNPMDQAKDSINKANDSINKAKDSI